MQIIYIITAIMALICICLSIIIYNIIKTENAYINYSIQHEIAEWSRFKCYQFMDLYNRNEIDSEDYNNKIKYLACKKRLKLKRQ